jgi:RHS repeat-associated protein
VTRDPYNVFRWYETQTGRYTRPDPMGLAVIEGATHLWPYAYADSNPISASDPLGLYTVLTKDPAFRQQVDAGFGKIQEGLGSPTCCSRYFSGRGVDLATWTQPGGPPYILRAEGKLRREMKRRKVCGAAQKGAPFQYFWLNPDCFKTPDPCKIASLLMHEMGHLARQDTADNEPADFFTACTLLGRCVDPGRGD